MFHETAPYEGERWLSAATKRARFRLVAGCGCSSNLPAALLTMRRIHRPDDLFFVFFQTAAKHGEFRRHDRGVIFNENAYVAVGKVLAVNFEREGFGLARAYTVGPKVLSRHRMDGAGRDAAVNADWGVA